MKNLIDCPAERAVYFLEVNGKLEFCLVSQNKKIRFGELKKGLQTLHNKCYPNSLRNLEDDGIINRKVIQVMPPKVEYSLN